MLFLVMTAMAVEPLTLEVRGLAAPTGALVCTVYATAETWLKRDGFVATTRVEVKGGTAICSFDAIEPGTYAVSFFHDVDGDGELAVNWVGLPKEPWGVSRDAPMAFGPPKFDSAAFTHPGPPQAASVR